MVAAAGNRWPLFLLAAPVVSLAVAVKYAGALFVPTVAVLAAVAATYTIWGKRQKSVAKAHKKTAKTHKAKTKSRKTAN